MLRRAYVCALVVVFVFAVLTITQQAHQPAGIAGLRIVGEPVRIFDYLVDGIGPNQVPDIAAAAWREADGTVNVNVSTAENYRMRGPDLESLVSDPHPIFSSAARSEDIVESHYNYRHWLAAPYSFDGRTLYALSHSEWHACLLLADCGPASNPKAYFQSSGTGAVTSMVSGDGGASWSMNGVDAAHVVSSEALQWTGTVQLANRIYQNADNLSGMSSPSRIIKEGSYYYAFADLMAGRNWAHIDPVTNVTPVERYDWVLMRTTDPRKAAGWEGWVSGGNWVPLATHGFTAFSPRIGSVTLSATPAQMIYDTNAHLYIVIFAVWGPAGSIYYVTTPSLANPIWSDAVAIGGSATQQTNPRNPAPCSTGFIANHYVSIIDSHSDGFNFEFTDGDPWLFFVTSPQFTCGAPGGQRDMYRLRLNVDYSGGARPAFSAQPATQRVLIGQTAQLTTTASAAQSLQWQRSTDGGVSWTNVNNGGAYSGATTATLSISASMDLSGARYRCLAANAAATAVSNAATLTVTAGAVSATPAALKFGATKAGASGLLTSVTDGQYVTVNFASVSSNWTATADQPWLQITNGAGPGAGQFTASIVNPGNVIGGATSLASTITVSAPGSVNGSVTVKVTLAVDQSNNVTTTPFGQVDTPVQNGAGIVGAVAVTGWTLDNIDVQSVKIFRNCLPSDDPGSCQLQFGNSIVYIGDAAFVPGARPDVEAAFQTYPQAYRAGWGYLLLTNMLPHVPNRQSYGGQGTLSLYAIATDHEGNKTLLGRTQFDHTPTSITLDNDHIVKPFGAIDLPGQGQTVSGVLPNFGWVLTPDNNTIADGADILVPADGSTMHVYIDGVSQGQVVYDQCRGSVGNPVPAGLYCNDDVADIFGNPAPQPAFTTRLSNPTRYRNLDAGRSAIGSFTIDTTTLSNGFHSLAWGVDDSAGRSEGIGSRNFIVLNANGTDAAPGRFGDVTGLASPPAVLRDAPAIDRGPASAISGLPLAQADIWGRTGFGVLTARVPVRPDAAGVRHLGMPEMGRMEVALGTGAWAGFLVANEALRDLPPGSHLDPATNVFTWVPLPGYIGTYRLAFVRDGDQHVPVDVTIRPAGSADPTQGEVRMFIDTPAAGSIASGRVLIAGWALDPYSGIGSAIDAVHVWATPAAGAAGPAEFLGAAMLGVVRPDVAAAFGEQFDTAGFWLAASPPPGEYHLVVYVHSARTARWEDARVVRVTVR